MKEYAFLDKINEPSDIKKLTEEQLEVLAEEIRAELIDTVSQTGGHLASNLGVVELTLALHRVFDSPNDQIVWDVGHQVYTHKLLTGRYKDFHTLRTENGISGFSRPYESKHDIFYSGHSSTSISSAFGLSSAKTLLNDKHHVIAVIGDGALTGGLAYEALNNAGRSKDRLIVILNDNEMSISQNVGSMARHLAVIRSKPGYYRLKFGIEKVLKAIPIVGVRLSNILFNLKSKAKDFIYGSTVFEDMGFRYMGPIDGHDIKVLSEALESAKLTKRPVLLHINTIKGKGYDFAEKDPSHFHGISKFDINTGEPLSSGTNFSAEFGDYLCKLAEDDGRICAITAAMALGTGLDDFSKKYKERFFDVGIAEEHAVTFASGLAKNGMIPVFVVYSTFLQRCYDQMIHDVAMQRLKIVIAIDRAGFVGEDGESHQGLFDVAMLSSVPGITIFSPSTYYGLKNVLDEAFYNVPGVCVVRYPRGSEHVLEEKYKPKSIDFDIFGNDNAKIAIVTYGRIFANACEAADILADEQNISVKILKLNKIHPISGEAYRSVLNCEHVFFFEDGIKNVGVAERFALHLLENNYKGSYNITAIDDQFVKHASVNSLLKKYQLDSRGMADKIFGSVKKFEQQNQA